MEQFCFEYCGRELNILKVLINDLNFQVKLFLLLFFLFLIVIAWQSFIIFSLKKKIVNADRRDSLDG